MINRSSVEQTLQPANAVPVVRAEAVGRASRGSLTEAADVHAREEELVVTYGEAVADVPGTVIQTSNQ